MVKRDTKVGGAADKVLPNWEEFQEAKALRKEREENREESDVSDNAHDISLDEFMMEQFQETTSSANASTSEEVGGGLPSLKTLREKFKTKSAVIRHLHSLGASVKEISKHTGIRYQMVRNVLTTELKRGPNEPFMVDNYRAPTLGPELPEPDFED